MSSKEIKSALKAARTSIQGKDYETALHHCDFILKRESTNYNALIFAGKCYSETNQNDRARDRYKDAIKCQPEQLLAYQGLENLYSKHWGKKKTKDELKDLIMIYGKLLSGTDRKDGQKRLELTVNLCDVFIELENYDDAFEAIKSELQHSDDLKMKVNLYEEIFKILQNVKRGLKTLEKYSDIVEEAFKGLIHASSSAKEAIAYLSQYLTFQQNISDGFIEKVPDLLDSCEMLHKKYPEECLPMEILIQAYIQKFNHPTLTETNIENMITKLESIDNPFARIAQGYLEFEAENFEKAFVILKDGIAKFSSFLPIWITLFKSAVKLHKHDDVKQFARKALVEYKQILTGAKQTWLLPITPLEEIQFELSKYLAIGLCGSHLPEDVIKGVGTFDKLLSLRGEDAFLLVEKAKGLIKLENFGDAKILFEEVTEIEQDNIEAKIWIKFVNFKIGDADAAVSELQSISPPSALSLYLLGKCMWEAGGEYKTDKKNCFAALVKAAKLDPYRGEIFLLLGHFYSKVQRDTTRAKGCYQKAYHLNPLSDEAASCLADAHVAEGDTDTAISLYEKITKEAGSGKWAWLRLGLYKLKAKDMTNAIQCFQSALRIDSNDAICWECLGEGYLQRGSYTAAWKAFDKAHQLNSQSIYSLYQMAKVKQVQGCFTEAIVEYVGVLKLSPEFVPALQGVGESELLHARQMFSDGRFQTGLGRIENAIEYLTKACYIRKDLCCLWKLLGDCCVMVQSLDGSVVDIKIPAVLVEKKNVNKYKNIGKSQVLALGVRFYCRAVQLQPDNASLWDDLGIIYFRCAEDNQICGKDDAIETAKKAMNAVKKAVVLEPMNHLFWTSLGVISASQFINEPASAQHCFLTSIQHEPNNVQAWSNLATLYLAHDQVKKSHEAFKVAQSLEPSFVNSWVGQALIAETIGSSETMDLYRHSTELGLQKQGAAGYSHWVAQVVADSSNCDSAIFKDNIRNMNAVATATTQMSKFCDKNPKCAWSSTIHGFLLENSGLNRSAENAYRKAYEVMSVLSSQNEDADKTTSENLKICVLNLARMCCENGNFEEAISLYQKIAGNLEFYGTCGLAYSFFKSGKFEKSLKTYNQAEKFASSEDEKAQVMVAMAMTYWKMEKRDEAKTMLYQCFQNCKQGLQTLLSLGIATRDVTLVGAAVGEVMKKKLVNCDDVADDCLLIAAAAKLCDDQNLALNKVQKAIHDNPSSWKLCVLFCRLLVDFSGCHGIISAPLISTQAEKIFNQQCVTNPLHRDSELWKSATQHHDKVKVQTCKAASLLAGGTTNSGLSLMQQCGAKLRQAQIFAHMHPYENSAWVMLACARHAVNVAYWFNGSELTDSSLVTSLIQSSSSNSDTNWEIKCDAWNKVLCGNSKQVDLENSDAKFVYLLNSASKTQDKAKLQPILKEITSTIGLTSRQELSTRYFGELLQHIEMQQVSRKMYGKSTDLTPENDVSKLSNSFRIALLAFNFIIVNNDEGKCKEWTEILKNSITEIVKINSKSPQSLLLQAFAMRIEKNHRKSKTFLNRILNSTEANNDQTRSIAIWYLYRTLHERDDTSEIEKLVNRAYEMEDSSIAKLIVLLPIS